MSLGEALVFVIGILFICLFWSVVGDLIKECVQDKLKELEEDLNDLPKNTFFHDVTNLKIALLKLLICIL